MDNLLKSDVNGGNHYPENLHARTKQTIIQLLSNLANPKEISQYLERFVNAGKIHFAVIKVGGSIIENDLNNLCSALAFLQQIGLFPIIVHGAGPQLSRKLAEKNIESQFIQGQRVTTKAILQQAKNTFIQQNLLLAGKLQSMGVKTASITSGVFIAKQLEDSHLGYVGEISQVDSSSIKAAITTNAIPIISPLAESESGQLLNVNADVATNQLAITLRPYKIIFLTETGGILDQNNKIISSINLVTHYNPLMQQSWLNGGMKLKLKQVAEILSQLPSTASVSITKPSHLAKELFTHRGSGTLIRKGESIMLHDSMETMKIKKLTKLIEDSFNSSLSEDYFSQLALDKALTTYCYRAAAVVLQTESIPYLDKFVVADSAKGEGLGKALWDNLVNTTPQFFWRARKENPIVDFYMKKADGMQKCKNWIVFWKGIYSSVEIGNCIKFAEDKPTTLLSKNIRRDVACEY